LVNWKHVQGQICTSLLATVMLLAPSKLIFQPKLKSPYVFPNYIYYYWLLEKLLYKSTTRVTSYILA